jgi:cyclase
MNHKRIIYALLYSKGFFYLSRNFRLQKVGDINWLKNNFGFGETCDFIDELIIILVTKKPDQNEISKFFEDMNSLREKIFVPITLGGGIRDIDHTKKCFLNGADKILINYLAYKDFKLIKKISQLFGEQAISIMVDYKNIEGINYAYQNSGTSKTKTLKKYFENIKNEKFGEIIVNSIDKDGTAFGFDFTFLNDLQKDFNKPLLIMGGAGKPEHFIEAFQNEKVSGAITANLFNFLGSGLKLAREHSINNGVKLIKFDKIEKQL